MQIHTWSKLSSTPQGWFILYFPVAPSHLVTLKWLMTLVCVYVPRLLFMWSNNKGSTLQQTGCMWAPGVMHVIWLTQAHISIPSPPPHYIANTNSNIILNFLPHCVWVSPLFLMCTEFSHYHRNRFMVFCFGLWLCVDFSSFALTHHRCMYLMYSLTTGFCLQEYQLQIREGDPYWIIYISGQILDTLNRLPGGLQSPQPLAPFPPHIGNLILSNHCARCNPVW